MSSILEVYKELFSKVEDINAKIKSKNSELVRLEHNGKNSYPARIENLEETLVKLDDYLLRVKGFQELAKKNLSSTNVLTIEAPPGYRVNLNRLRNWAMLIDPTSNNDPYAQRVYVVSKCDECFLEKKKKEFTAKLEALKNADESSLSAEMLRLNNVIKELQEQLKDFGKSPEVTSFANELVSANKKYWITSSPTQYPCETLNDSFAPGAMLMPFPLHKDNKELIKNQLGTFYDEKGDRVLVPFEIPFNKEFIMTVACSPARSKQIDKAIQNIILNYMCNNQPGEKEIYVIDSARFNTSSLGGLRTLENTIAFNKIPRNPDQVTATLESIVSKMTDYDELIDAYDSVREYNESLEDKTKLLSTSLIVLYGWPKSFSASDRDLIQKIIMNYERFGVSFITVSFTTNDTDIDKIPTSLTEYAANNAIKVVMKSKETTIQEPEKKARRFFPYSFNEELNSDFIKNVQNFKFENFKKDNQYINWVPLDEEHLMKYERQYKPIELPFGMDAKDKVHSMSFENENFAAYLVGASRSGKSTLLHTLIAGIIRNYHPDNVELWLADFKQLEFKKYIDHCPPHVKYVLLDESTELVFDLIDKLTDIMLERQKKFARDGVQRIDQYDYLALTEPMPIVFVILDEFSIMSQSIADSPVYKLKLQNLLAKGAALGIRFLFSSQTFTTGVAGLSATARAQIQQRISMKGAREEISETLELSSNAKTDLVKNWMDSLPPHYALVKYRTKDIDAPPQVKRFLVMYFKDFKVRDDMIDYLNKSMKKSDTFNINDIKSYKDKHPVLVDGNTYDAYNLEEFMEVVNREKQTGDYVGDEMFISYGTPRLMTRYKLNAISNETRENILLVARSIEQQCATSIIMSSIKSYIAQGGKVEIWTYSKNQLYRANRELLAKTGASIVEDIDSICDSIYTLKQRIIEKQKANILIVLIGMDRICVDFDFVDKDASNQSYKTSVDAIRQSYIDSGATVENDEDAKLAAFGTAWAMQRMKKKKELEKQGLSQNEINEKLKEIRKNFEKQYSAEHDVPSADVSKRENSTGQIFQRESNKENENVHEAGAYNALDDFAYVVKQGSRLGIHFMLYLNNFADLKSCGFKNISLFRYKLAFQLSVDDSRNMFNNKSASILPEHICKYDDGLDQYSFRPYLHYGVGWEGWHINEDGTVFNPYKKI